VLDDFGVVFLGQMMVGLAEQLLLERLKIRELSVKPEREPLPLLNMVPLERLGVAAVLCPAGGVADVPDRRPAGVLPHQALGLAAM
jgi:hypothetical protein